MLWTKGRHILLDIKQCLPYCFYLPIFCAPLHVTMGTTKFLFYALQGTWGTFFSWAHYTLVPYWPYKGIFRSLQLSNRFHMLSICTTLNFWEVLSSSTSTITISCSDSMALPKATVKKVCKYLLSDYPSRCGELVVLFCRYLQFLQISLLEIMLSWRGGGGGGGGGAAAA